MKQSYQLSGNFIEEVFRISGGYLKHEELDSFFSLLESEAGKFMFTRSSENNLLRIINSFFDRTLFLKDAVKYPYFIEILTVVSANSNYLCDIFVRDPEFFYWIVNPVNLQTEPSREDFNKNVKEISGRYRSFNSKLNALKSFKRKEILRIGLKDLLQISSLNFITEQLSALASSILDALFRLCLDETAKKYDIKFTNSYCVTALGKLGGRELNYSSDTDLIVFYDKDKKYKGKYYSEYLIETIKLFIESSSGLTDNGYLYRIDLRLRPEGKNSPLCRSINEYLSYYESKGESWERQMLIKSDFISGDMELYNKFTSYLVPFIYPSAQQISPLDQIRKLKSDIEKNLKQELNIKLTKGGIRDIEFVVQALQLLNGGKIKEVRQSNTLKGIEKLALHDLISEDEKNILSSSYNFFRRIEHYLQLMNDRQTHTIPEAGEIVDKMANFLGYERRMQFLSVLNDKRKAIRDIYLSFIPGNNMESVSISIFRNKQNTEKNIDYLRTGRDITGEKSFDKSTQHAFSKLESVLMKALAGTPDPDLVIRDLASVIRSAAFPSIWYNQLRDDIFLNYFILTCTYSEKAVKLMISDPAIQDFMLSRRVFADYKFKELAVFPVNKFMFYLYVNLAVKKLNVREVSDLLTLYCIEKLKEIAIASIGRKNYFIAAMGSLGSGEMTFSSDLDLIFVVNESTGQKEKEFLKILSVMRKELYLFKVDCRLRPEGEGSQLVWESDSYLKYINIRARIWELQALCRLNFIAGDKSMFDVLVSSIIDRIGKENCDAIKKSILEMRTKIEQTGIISYSKNFNIKKSPGGLTDIEFILQYLILCTPGLYSVCRGRNIDDIINTISNSADKFSNLEELRNNYYFFKEIKFTIQNAFDTEKAVYPPEIEKKRIIAAYIGADEDKLDNLIKEKIRRNNQLFNQYFKEK